MTLASRIAAPIWWLVRWASPRHREARKRRWTYWQRQCVANRVLSRRVQELERELRDIRRSPVRRAEVLREVSAMLKTLNEQMRSMRR